MAAEAGIGGLVKIGAVTVANLNTWSVSPKINVVNTTAFQAAGSWAQKLGTIKDWTAKFDGFLDPTDATGQVALINGLGSAFTFEFDVDATHKWTGPGILVGIDPKSDVAQANTISFSVDGNGALVYS